MSGRYALLAFAVVVAAVVAQADDVVVFSEWLSAKKGDPSAHVVSDYQPKHSRTVCLKEAVDQNCICSTGYVDNGTYVCQDDYVEMLMTCCDDQQHDLDMLADLDIAQCDVLKDHFFPDGAKYVPEPQNPTLQKYGNFHIQCRFKQRAESCGKPLSDKMVLTAYGSMYYADKVYSPVSDPPLPVAGQNCFSRDDPIDGRAVNPAQHHAPNLERIPTNGRMRRAAAKPAQASSARRPPYEGSGNRYGSGSPRQPRMGYPGRLNVYSGTFYIVDQNKGTQLGVGLMDFIWDFDIDADAVLEQVPADAYMAAPFTMVLKFVDADGDSYYHMS